MADRWAFTAIALLAAGLLVPGLLAGPSLDAAVFVQVASQLSAGKTLYVDAWDHKPPGVYLIFAAGQLLLPFLDRWISAWLVSYGATVGTAVTIRLILNGVGVRPGPAWLAGSVAVVVMAQYLTSLGGGLTEPIATLFLAVATLVALRSTSWWQSPLTGVLLGVAVLVSATSIPGALSATVIAAAAARSRLKALALVAVGMSVVVTAVAAWLAAEGALGAALRAVVGYSAAYRAANQEVGPMLTRPVASWTALSMIFAIVPAALGMGPGWRAGGRRAALTGVSVVWIALSLVLFVFQGRFFAHYAISLTVPLAVLTGIGLERAMAFTRGPRYRVSAMCAVPLLLGVVISVGAGTVGGSMEFKAVTRHNQRVAEVAAAIRSLAGAESRIWVWGAAPQLYLASGRQPATPYGYLYPLVTPGFTTEETIREAVDALAGNPPAVIVDAGSPKPGAAGFHELLIDRPLATDGRDLDLLNPIREFVAERYERSVVVDGWVIYRVAGSN